jgi:hypothetical protein
MKNIRTKLNLVSFLLFAFIFIIGCSPRQIDFEVKDFHALKNYTDSILYLDYEGAHENGFVIPSVRQAPGGEFEVDFSIKNTGKQQKFYYKLFYQNESYKFPDDNMLCNENFYGSWEDVSKAFIETAEIASDGDFHKINDQFRIVGNPLNDTTYYSTPEQYVDSIKVLETANKIKESPEWFASIKDKSRKNNISVEHQLLLDAAYVVKDQTPLVRKNNPWKRNIRVGKYSFMLVVCTADALQKIPAYIQNISIRNGNNFVSPYYYFLFGKGSILANIVAVKSERYLKVIAKPDLGGGIYISHEKIGDLFNRQYLNQNCNDNNKLFNSAHFEQFFHDIDQANKFENIPVAADVTGGEYSKADYNKNNKYSSAQLSRVPIGVSDCPCKTAEYDSIKRKIILKNPASSDGKFRKENVGIILRHGLTYGKYRVKAKLPELLNKYNIWNGLTNAIWLYRQTGEWNKRRVCYAAGGYMPKNTNDPNAKRQLQSSYSEIDIEIVKANRNWPQTSYSNATIRPDNPVSDSDKVMVTYTNWDLSCRDPENFGVGVHDVQYNGNSFELHRWDNWYQALTGKYAAPDDELFKGPYFWYEIEWKPDEIIWRMGPEKNKMRVIGYVNQDVSSIPNNQMLLVITQEWHLANWWPEAPFDQNRIPFPKKDIVGEVMEIEVE